MHQLNNSNFSRVNPYLWVLHCFITFPQYFDTDQRHYLATNFLQTKCYWQVIAYTPNSCRSHSLTTQSNPIALEMLIPQTHCQVSWKKVTHAFMMVCNSLLHSLHAEAMCIIRNMCCSTRVYSFPVKQPQCCKGCESHQVYAYVSGRRV